MIELLASKVSKLKAEQYPEEAGAPCSFTFSKPNPYRGTQQQLQMLQRNKVTNEDKGVRPLLQNIVMEEELFEEEEEVHGLEDKGSAHFLTRAAYEEALSRDTSYQLVVDVEQQVDQHEQVVADPFILEESELEACPSSHDYADLQIRQHAIIPGPVINKGEESSPSSFVPLSAQMKLPHSCPLNTEARNSSMLKA